ncbi:WecB/TagA/CpsF family glycosyltransferase [Streptosporangium sp. NPDC051022]|uniref:WecB/TagA/CpsF family glycosyltransferase n=1 Tax=Streptosporangium sp. NPDC051022 TaxID=3155752 RepID=UPI0034254D1F
MRPFDFTRRRRAAEPPAPARSPHPIGRPTDGSGPSRLRVGAVEVMAISEDEVLDHVSSAWRLRRGGSIVTANVDIIRAATFDPALADLITRSELVVADGMPVVWAGRLAGTPLPGRVTGSSLVYSLTARAARENRSVFLLGGAPGVPEAAARALADRHPGLRVAGACSPPYGFDATAEGMRRLVGLVTAAAPDLVLVGLGFPKQERTIRALRAELPDAWYIGCGAGIPMAAGQFSRAPEPMQRIGAEWLYRLAQEPRRLARRYLRDDLLFAVVMLAGALRSRLKAGRYLRGHPLPPARSSNGDAFDMTVPARPRPTGTVTAPVRAASPDGPVPPADYVCFSAQDWWYHNQAHSDFQLMRSVAVHRRVLVVNSIGLRMPTPGNSTQVLRRIGRKLRSVAMLVRRPLRELPNFYVMSPLPLPLYGSPLARRLNAALVRAQVLAVSRALGLRRPVIMVTLPTAWDAVRPMRRRALVFNRSDLHSEFPESDGQVIATMERDLLRRSDHVIYVSNSLMDDERDLTGPRAYFLDHGVDTDHFRPRPVDRQPEDLRRIPGPRVGFFGALDDYFVDFDLLERIAVELPGVSLVLIGNANVPMGRLTRHPNVHWLGHRPYEEIPAYGSGFDVAIMPRPDIPWIRYSNPIKLKEYLALGLPVVTSDSHEIRNYADRVRIASDPDDFVAAVRTTLREGGLRPAEELRESVLDASWSSRAAQLMTLAETPPRHRA